MNKDQHSHKLNLGFPDQSGDAPFSAPMAQINSSIALGLLLTVILGWRGAAPGHL